MNYNLYRPSEIARIKEKHGFINAKKLGQNFLADKNIICEIIDGSGMEKGDMVIEVGPGIGALTAAAAERAGTVIGIEVDDRLIPVLRDTLSEYKNVKILHADIMKTDLAEIINSEREKGGFTGNVRIIGNLPYYITTPIIMMLLEKEVPADSITVMMQKEVADRLLAPIGTREAGAVTVAVNYYSSARLIADVPKEVFVPRPKVDSAVVRLDIREQPPVDISDRDIFFQIVKNGFGKRRKTLLNSLTGAAGLTREQTAEALADAGIDSTRRIETLNMSELADIANSVCRLA